MKATKKIVGAACALVAAVALSAGSTFAWFSTNGSVDATGMKIEVSTNNAYLIISDSAATLDQEAKTMTLASGTKALLPSAYRTATIENGALTGTVDNTKKSQEGTDSITDAGSWYTGQGTSSTNGTLSGTATTLTDFAGYVVEDDIFVAVSSGSTAIEKIQMSVTAKPVWTYTDGTTQVTEGEGDDATTKTVGTNNGAISVVILYHSFGSKADAAATGDNFWKIAELSQKGNEYGAANHKFSGEAGDILELGGLEPSQTYANYIQIHVMVYFDGNNASVKTANSANLTGVTLDFNFSDPAQAETPNP